MSIELNKLTFRRLVQIYLVLFLVSIPLTVWQVLSPTYEAFDLEFQALVARYYGHTGYSDGEMVAAGVLLLIHLASVVGMLWFKPWARLLFWSSIMFLLAFDVIVGTPVEWLDRWGSWGQVLGSALFGAIILLAYSRGHGEVWFRADEKEVT